MEPEVDHPVAPGLCSMPGTTLGTQLYYRRYPDERPSPEDEREGRLPPVDCERATRDFRSTVTSLSPDTSPWRSFAITDVEDLPISGAAAVDPGDAIAATDPEDLPF